MKDFILTFASIVWYAACIKIQ